MPRVLYLLPKLHGDFKRLSLEIILSQASSYEGLFIELKNRGFADILARRFKFSKKKLYYVTLFFDV